MAESKQPSLLTWAEGYLTVQQLAQKYPAFSESSLRWHIQKSKTNGLSPAVIRIGRKILINESEFLSWLTSKSQGETV